MFGIFNTSLFLVHSQCDSTVDVSHHSYNSYVYLPYQLPSPDRPPGAADDGREPRNAEDSTWNYSRTRMSVSATRSLGGITNIQYRNIGNKYNKIIVTDINILKFILI